MSVSMYVYKLMLAYKLGSWMQMIIDDNLNRICEDIISKEPMMHLPLILRTGQYF